MTALEKRVQQSEMEARERKEAIAELQRNLQAARNSVQALQNQPKKKGRSCIVM